MNPLRFLTQYFSKEVKSAIQPKTVGASTKGGGAAWYETDQTLIRSPNLLLKYITIYEKGGILSDAFDQYPIFMLSKGWGFEGEPGAITQCEEFINGFDFHKICSLLITSSLVCGDAFDEVATGKGAKASAPVALLHRDPTKFSVVTDDRGICIGYEQDLGMNRKLSLPSEVVCHVQLIPAIRGEYGTSLMKRCFDEAIRDTKIVTGLSNAIDRHGTPKWLGRVGKTPEEDVTQSVLDTITTALSNLNSKTSLAVPKSVEVQQLDTSGIQGVQAYQEMSLLRLLGAIGVPGELVGWRQGTTDNTAVSRIRAFLLKCESMNLSLARQLNLQVFDKVTGRPGAASIRFKSLLLEDTANTVSWITNVMKADPLDPYGIISKEQIQEKLGLIEQ